MPMLWHVDFSEWIRPCLLTCLPAVVWQFLPSDSLRQLGWDNPDKASMRYHRWRLRAFSAAVAMTDIRISSDIRELWEDIYHLVYTKATNFMNLLVSALDLMSLFCWMVLRWMSSSVGGRDQVLQWPFPSSELCGKLLAWGTWTHLCHMWGLDRPSSL